MKRLFRAWVEGIKYVLLALIFLSVGVAIFIIPYLYPGIIPPIILILSLIIIPTLLGWEGSGK
jgi:uncharacterized membrane protein